MTDRLQSLRGEGAKLWKMMADADGIETLEQGMELSEAFGAPIETADYEDGAADDPMVTFELTDHVRETIQQTLYGLLGQRRNAFLG